MKLEEIFKLSEDGSLTFEQFKQLVEDNKAKFVDLSEGNYVSQSKYDDAQAKAQAKYDTLVAKHQEELNLRDTRIHELDEAVTKGNTDLEELQAKLKDAGQDAEKLAKLNDDLSSLQAKYDESQSKYAKDIEAYQGKLSKQAYEFAVKDYARGQKFTSKAARNDFVRQMLAKNLQMEDGKILGADDFTNVYRKDNEDAFKVEEPKKDPEPKPEPEPKKDPEPKPKFVGKTPGASGEDSKDNQFSFNFAGVRAHK